jgi:hypothetical protein
VRAILIPLSAAEEIALRKVHLSSSAIAPNLMARLKALALIERTGGGWRLTPLGMRRHDELADVPLRDRGPSIIDDILDRYIPLAQARRIVKPAETEHDAAGTSGLHLGPRPIDSVRRQTVQERNARPMVKRLAP